MSTVTRSPVRVQDILMSRPYLAWARIPLAAALCTLDYDDAARAEILDRLRDGADLRDLAPWLVEPSDLPALEAAVAEGRTPGWIGRYRERGGFLRPICGGSDGDVDRSIPPTAVLVPPELDALDELLAEDARWDDTRVCPCGRAVESDPCRCEPFDPMGGLPPIAGGSGDDAAWCDEPTDGDWDRLRDAARDWPPSGGLD